MNRKRREDPVVHIDQQELAAMEEKLREAHSIPDDFGPPDAEEVETRLPEMVQLTHQEYELLASKASSALEAERQIQRWQADFENFRRRTQREREDLEQYAAAELISKLLPVLDNFDRAMTASYENPASLRTGVEMIRKQQMELLCREGLVPLHPLGEPFNPELHEAVMRCDATGDTPDNTVVEVVQTGYMLKNRLLRPAMVKVALK